MKNYLKIIIFLILCFTGLIFIVIAIYFFSLNKAKRLNILLQFLNINKRSNSKIENKIIEKVEVAKEDKIEKNLEAKVGPKPKTIKSKVNNTKNIEKKLSERQKDVLKIFSNKSEITLSDIVNKFQNVSSRTLRRDLSKLEELSYIKQFGKTKNSIYKSIK